MVRIKTKTTMTQEERELFIALCGYLPYETKIQCNTDFDIFDDILTTDYIHGMFFTAEDIDCIPYLRPMDSMTTEEKAYYFAINESPVVCVDWLNKNKFDYRGFNWKGLALEALKDMYKYNN